MTTQKIDTKRNDRISTGEAVYEMALKVNEIISVLNSLTEIIFVLNSLTEEKEICGTFEIKKGKLPVMCRNTKPCPIHDTHPEEKEEVCAQCDVGRACPIHDTPQEEKSEAWIDLLEKLVTDPEKKRALRDCVKYLLSTTAEEAFIQGYEKGNDVQLSWEQLTKASQDDFLSAITKQ